MKTILITGTTNGIGRVTALELARQGHTILMANRSREKSEAVQADIIEQTGNDKVSLFDLDLASLDSINQCTDDIKASVDAIDVVLCNAGLLTNDQVITEDGFELQFQVNALSQLQFALNVLPLLEAAAPSHLIFVTSMMHKMGKLNYDSFTGWEKYSGSPSYNQSKLAMMLLAGELSERLAAKQITVSTIHPGAVDTGILDNYSGVLQWVLKKLFVAPEKGAVTSIYLAGQDPQSLPQGKYFINKKPAKAHRLVNNAAARQKLWDHCCGLLNCDSEAA